MKFHNKFLGGDVKNVSTNYITEDDENRYLQNLKTCDDNWYFKNNNNVNYNINDNGHRCKNINDIDLDNYILFAGCSHTYGVGLALEDTFPYLISKTLNCDYYNLALGGTGIDVLEYNILTWMGTIAKKPKLIFIQMPDHSRFAAYNPYVESSDLYFVEKGSWVENKDELEMIVNCETSGMFNARKFLVSKLLDVIIDVPILKLNVWGHDGIHVAGPKLRSLDTARDLAHMGIVSNKKFAEDIVEYISQNYSHIVPT